MVVIEHEDNKVTLTVSSELNPAQRKLLCDTLIKLLDSVDDGAPGRTRSAVRIDPDQLSVPVVMIENERYVTEQCDEKDIAAGDCCQCDADAGNCGAAAEDLTCDVIEDEDVCNDISVECYWEEDAD